MPYIRMDKNTGVVDASTFRQDTPPLTDVKMWRWLEVLENIVQSWESNGPFPATVDPNSSTISRTVVTPTLAAWKARRVGDIQNEQWRRMAAAYPQGKVTYYIIVALRIIWKRANGGTLTAGETTTLTAINNAFVNTLEPIGAAAEAAITAINAANSHAAVETAYLGVTWP